MRGSRIILAVLVLFGTALACSSAWAQPGRGGGGMMGRGGGMMGRGGGGMLGLLRSSQVQKELELVDEQKTKLTAISTKLSEKMRAEIGPLFAGLRELPEEERAEKMAEAREKMQKTMQDIMGDAEKEVGKILMPHQLKRLKEINVQVQGDRALSDPAIIKALGLSEAQQAKLKKIGEGLSTQRREMFSGFRDLSSEERRERFAGAREKLEKAGEEAKKQALNVLTDDQKKTLAEMKGEKFELDRSQLFQRGGREGGGRREGGRRPERPTT